MLQALNFPLSMKYFSPFVAHIMLMNIINTHDETILATKRDVDPK